MSMKKWIVYSGLLFFLFSCNNDGKDIPDISGIKADVSIKRFDRDIANLDSNNVAAGLNELYQQNPQLTTIFLENILGLDSASTLTGVKNFLTLSQNLFDTINIVFKDTKDLEKQFQEAFRYVKYYYPQYQVPVVYTVAGPMDALAQSDYGLTPNFLRPGIMGISLQFYLGKDFSVYQDPFFIQNVAPLYRSRRFSKEYIIADAIQLVVNDLFPDQSSGKPLIEQMVEKGKQWYLLDKFLPTTSDSVKTGYTQLQLDWCSKNEGMIWTYIIKNEDLQSLNPAVLQTYIGEAPFTQGMPQDYSPGNIGQWIGWQIVKKFAEKNSALKPEDIMKTPAAKIIEEAKYKPK
ncbi:MAG TPA: hypothetical protein PK092_05320 [Chitinophagaceae bacterium]|nr:hypothetical protein [Chitinophagaceae bacterium]